MFNGTRHTGIPAGLIGVFTLLVGCSTAPSGILVPIEMEETAITRQDVPPAALATLEALAMGAPIVAYEREDRGNLVAFVGEWMLDGMEMEATVLADGTLLETERDIAEAEMIATAPGLQAQAENWRAEGYNVEFSRREIVLYDVTLTTPDSVEEKEFILLPSGEFLTESK